jgi:excisionase family DNA binding protein
MRPADLPPAEPRLPGFFLVSEAAKTARVSEWTIRREIKEGRLKARRIGRLVRILDGDLANWMRGGGS